ncbi:hypothetical protein F5883DRAFT_656639 [Diaporthe sp. PMI_573]|nr:hypothetical protein F5883DRAFT_656639 [Diaporthaceae sp. PMI_573]
MNQSDPAARAALFRPISSTFKNLAAVPTGAKVLWNTATIPFLIIMQFFFILALNGITLGFDYYSKIPSKTLIQLRFGISIVYTFIASLTSTGYIWAFRQGFHLTGSQFVETWMAIWLTNHTNFLFVDTATAIVPMAYMSHIGAMDVSAEPGSSNPFIWLSTLIMALDLNFLITFFYNQFRRLPKPEKKFTGKTVIVTGANVGLGLEAARYFVRLDAAKVVLACRDTEKGERAKADIERSTARSDIVEVWPLDLCSFESVKQFCRRVGQLPRLDVVVENAAVAYGGPVGKLAEGFESTITVNVLGTACNFPHGVADSADAEADRDEVQCSAQLVIVSSYAHFVASFKERTAPKIFEAFKSSSVTPDRYQTSKLMGVFLTRQLAQEMSKPTSNSKGQVILNTLNPGFCRTALFRDNKFPASIFLNLMSQLIGRSAEVGSRVIVDAAAAGPETHGSWLDTLKIREPSAYVRSEEGQEMQRRLYDELMEILDGVEPNIARNI